MYTVMIVLLVLLMFASLVGVSVGIDNSVQKEGKDIQITTGGGVLSLVLLFFSSIALTIILRTTAIVTMWGWFVSPIFNIPAPTKALAYGLAMFYLLFNFPDPRGKKSTKAEYLTIFTAPITTILMIFGIGWVTHQFFV